MKACNSCDSILELDQFWFNKKRNMYHYDCKKCKYEKYINVSKEKKAGYDKKYREIHNEELKISKKIEYEKNKQKYIDRTLKYNKTIIGRIKHNIRSRIRNSVKNKSDSSKDLLGCEIDFYIKFIEYQFDENMNWDNYGI